MVNLHFHHVDPTTKSFALSVATGKALSKLREEAKKCVLVCANCHGEIESRLIRVAARRCHVRAAYNRTPAHHRRGRGVAVSTLAFHGRDREFESRRGYFAAGSVARAAASASSRGS